MIVVALKGFFFVGTLYFYSAGVWNMINGYFGREFQAYLEKHPPPTAPLPPPSPPPSPPSHLLTPEMPIEGVTSTPVALSHGGELRGCDWSRIINFQAAAGVCEVEDMDFVDDGGLIGSAALNQKPIDETWWTDYWRLNPRESRSAGQPEDEHSCPIHRPDEAPACPGEDCGQKSCRNA